MVEYAVVWVFGMMGCAAWFWIFHAVASVRHNRWKIDPWIFNEIRGISATNVLEFIVMAILSFVLGWYLYLLDDDPSGIATWRFVALLAFYLALGEAYARKCVEDRDLVIDWAQSLMRLRQTIGMVESCIIKDDGFARVTVREQGTQKRIRLLVHRSDNALVDDARGHSHALHFYFDERTGVAFKAMWPYGEKPEFVLLRELEEERKASASYAG